MVDISEWRSSYEYNHLHGHLHHHDNHPYGHLHHLNNYHPDPQQPQPACLLDTSRPQDNNSLRHVDFLFSIGLKFHFHPALIGISKCSLVPQVHLQVLFPPFHCGWAKVIIVNRETRVSTKGTPTKEPLTRCTRVLNGQTNVGTHQNGWFIRYLWHGDK